MRRRVGSLLAALALLCVAGGCQKATDCACVVVWFDASVGAPDVRERYREDFHKVVDELRPGTRIVGDILTENTEQRVSWRIDETVPQFNWRKDSNVQHAARVAAVKKRVLARADELLAAEATNSDIMSGFLLATKVFGGERSRDCDSKVMVVFSDGIEQTERYDFTENAKLTEQRIDEIIGAENAVGRLPDLTGVTVHIAGINARPDPKAQMTPEKMAWVQQFWTKYAAACHAELDQANCGPRLTNFALP